MHNKSLRNLLNLIHNAEKFKVHHGILPQNILPGAQHTSMLILTNYKFQWLISKINTFESMTHFLSLANLY
jgi:hypothetical protein